MEIHYGNKLRHCVIMNLLVLPNYSKLTPYKQKDEDILY